MADRKRHNGNHALFNLDPKLVRISEEEIRADLLYRGGERKRPVTR